MRKAIWIAAAFVFVIPAGVRGQQPAQSNQNPQSQPAPQNPSSTQSQAAPAPGTTTVISPQDSLAAAARRAREQKKQNTKPPRVFTNDNIPTQGGISTIGEAGPANGSEAQPNAPSNDSASSSGGFPNGNDEKGWRALFGKLHHKLDQDQAELDVLQRELGTLMPQYYSDPTKALMQSVTRSDINNKTAKIDQKKQDIESDKQAISDAEDALRKSGGDRGWAE